MYILAFESSCDDTSVALLQDTQVLALETHTQTEHTATAGVVPEVAARLHAGKIFELLDRVFATTGLTPDDIDLLACTSEPGLVPSLLVGKTVAQTWAQFSETPLVWVNHIQAHIYSLFLDRALEQIRFPLTILSASGGHNDLFYWDTQLIRVSTTRDDSACETLDKVGREMGLPFPAGMHIDRLAAAWQASPHFRGYQKLFPVVDLDGYDFSFSGLKSAGLREIQQRKIAHQEQLTERDLEEIAFEYQEAVLLSILKVLKRRLSDFPTSQLGVVGGLSANQRMKTLFTQQLGGSLEMLYPLKGVYSRDNAAMIGILAYLQHTDQVRS